MASKRLFGQLLSEGKRGEVVPASNPDTAPDSSDLSGICPRCGRASNFELLGSLPVTFGGAYSTDQQGRHVWSDLDRVSVVKCRGCGQGTAVVEEQWVGELPAREGWGQGGALYYKGVHWWPPPGSADLDEAIPEGLRDSYAEGMRSIAARAPRGASVMLRRTVEGIVR
jgi:hypothetical protein